MEAIDKIIKNKKYLVFLDFEGTQFSHEIIAIGAVKCLLKNNGELEIVDKFKEYVLPLGLIGKIVENMTSITTNLLKEKGVSLEEMLNHFNNFINTDFNECAFIVFGSNDAKMIIDSINYQQPDNASIGYAITKNIVDYLNIISTFIKDDNGNNYSLTNYLKLFSIEPYGISHDPYNDAYDLMNLYIGFNQRKDIVFEEYLKILKKYKGVPTPVKKIMEKLVSGEDVSSDEFKDLVKEYIK